MIRITYDLCVFTTSRDDLTSRDHEEAGSETASTTTRDREGAGLFSFFQVKFV